MRYPKIVVTPPGPKAKAIIERDAAVISSSYGRVYPTVIQSGEGCIITDVDGNEFIDFNSGLAVLNVGLAIVTCGVSTIRIAPPLIITPDLIDASLMIFEESLGEVEASRY